MFFWKRKPKEQPEQEALEPLQQFDTEELKEKLAVATGEERIQYLDQLGTAFMQQKAFDAAIRYYEMSLEEHKVLGKACTDLMSLYNLKRREAAMIKDDEKIQFYLEKVDELMKVTKALIRKV